MNIFQDLPPLHDVFCITGVGPFLESLLRSLENMLDNSLYVNLQTTSVLAAIASYPQPLIAHYLFDQRMLLQSGVKNLFKVNYHFKKFARIHVLLFAFYIIYVIKTYFKVMEILKTRIDAYASSLDGFDVLLERGIKFLRSRAERYEKVMSLDCTFPSTYDIYHCP